jgi:hypothetical protein
MPGKLAVGLVLDGNELAAVYVEDETADVQV